MTGDYDIGRVVRIGTVSDVDNEKHLARVIYKDAGMTSSWLRVVDNRPYIPDYDVPQRTEYEAGGSFYAEFASHKHDLIIKQWMPHINDAVLVLCNPINDSDGFILGAVNT